MMHFFKIFPLLPMIPALLVFGLGMASLYFGKKVSSPCLKIGGFVMSIGTLIIIIFLMVACVKVHMHPMGMNGPMMGGRCPMMEMMKEGHDGYLTNMPDQSCGCNCPTNCPMMNNPMMKHQMMMNQPKPMHPMTPQKK
ncbi:MAG: hypothetical protein NTY22_09755 [Proteobacteria bacterium]|nr:hypothetical protein [Pseudomonadota bacterium]